jgi:hypothetical protein
VVFNFLLAENFILVAQYFSMPPCMKLSSLILVSTLSVVTNRLVHLITFYVVQLVDYALTVDYSLWWLNRLRPV